jgi:hypothetical protein
MSSLSTLLSFALAVLAGALAASVYGRWHFAHNTPTFRCKLRWPEDTWPGPSPRWPHHRVRAGWVHDVLVLYRGVLRPRPVILAVRTSENAFRTTKSDVSGLGRNPVVLALRLDDGTVVELATRDTGFDDLVGPFLAASMRGLPPAAVERWPRRS